MSQDLEFKEKRRFIIKLGKALHTFGTPAYRLEEHLMSVAKLLNLQGYFLVTPTSLTFVISESEEGQEHTHIVRVNPGEIDLGSLARTDELVDELSSGQRRLSEAVERLDEIENKPEPYSKAITFLAFGGSSGAFTMLMHTHWNDVFWSVILAFIVCLFVFSSQNSKRITSMLEPFSAITMAILASAITLIDPSINVSLVVLSSIITFIPGLALTLGLSELSSKNLMSGTARIMDALMLLFKLYFGSFLGLFIGDLLWGKVEMTSYPGIPTWTSFISVALLSISLIILFKARIKDAPWGVISGYIAYGSSIWAALYLGGPLSAFVGAFVLGLYSNIFSRWMNLPSSIVKLLGLVVLVPGSKVYIGLNTAISGQSILNSTDIGSQAFLIFMSLIAGLLFSDVVLPPRKML